MKRSVIVAAAVLVAALLIGSGAGAQGMMGGYGYGPGYQGGQGNWGMNRYYQSLPEDKREAFDKIVNAYQAKMWELHGKLRSRQLELDGVLSEPTVDEKKAEALSGEIGNLMAEMHKQMAAMQVALRKAGLPPMSGHVMGGFGQGYGHGMMGGYGMGPGMSGGYGYGMGPGMRW